MVGGITAGGLVATGPGPTRDGMVLRLRAVALVSVSVLEIARAEVPLHSLRRWAAENGPGLAVGAPGPGTDDR
ncbi:hypothetical protein [Actinomadura sp. 3N407]|uniref:hypothetical protein n=1 Tax=Actinomadura sp. 3N407 TaxID=3457423 RepID=UPI003FCD5BE5